MTNQNTALLLRSPNDVLYDYWLSSAYKSAWIYDPSLPLAKDPDIWETVRRDPVILSAMDRRVGNIVRPWRVEPPKGAKREVDKAVAGVVQDAIGQISRLNAARKLLCNAHFLGRSYAYIEGDYKFLSLDGTADMLWWVPTQLVDIDRRRFHFVADWHKDEIGKPWKSTHLELWSTDRNKWEIVSSSYRRALIEYTYGLEEGRVGNGRGLLEATYFYSYFKAVGFEKIQQGVDRWANGILTYEIDGEIQGSNSKTNQDLKLAAKRLLQNARTEHVIIHQKGDKIEVLETSGTGGDMALNVVRYLDESIERLYNGSLRPSGHGSGQTGARAEAETQADTSESFYQDDRDDLDEVMDNYVVRLFWSHPQNRANLARLHTRDGTSFAMGRRPQFHSRQERKEDPKQMVEVAGQLMDRGVALLEEEVYERCGGWSVPAQGQKTIVSQAPPVSPMGGGIPGGPSPLPGEDRFDDRGAQDVPKPETPPGS
jgi:hypothetical protein